MPEYPEAHTAGPRHWRGPVMLIAQIAGALTAEYSYNMALKKSIPYLDVVKPHCIYVFIIHIPDIHKNLSSLCIVINMQYF